MLSRQPHVDYGTAKLHRSWNRWGSDRFSSKDRFWSANARMNMAETHHATKHRGGFFAVAALLGTALAGGVAWYARRQIGGATCRDRVCQYVSIAVVAVSLNKKLIRTINASYIMN